MQSIGIIVFYFGKIPWYQKYFISSCKRNPSINFLFFTDNIEHSHIDQNIHFIKFTIEKFNFLSSFKLGFKINIKNGLKICDLRPAFGLIFEDYLKIYDFWGYSDTDIILGNLRDFLDQEALQNDYISVKEEYPSGFFSVFKNTKMVNELFRKSKDYKKLFIQPENTLFEECGGAYNEVCNGINILDSSCKFETFHHVLEKNKEVIKSLFEFFSIEGNVGSIKVDQDKLVFMEKYEVMMYHLTSYKSNLFSLLPKKEIKVPFYIHKFTFSKTKLNFKYTTIKKSLLQIYIFKLAQFISKSTTIKNTKLKNGIYKYMDEQVKINSTFQLIDLKTKEIITIKKIPFSSFFLLENKILRVTAEDKFEIVQSNGYSKTFTYSK